jgi:tyrosyl-tRNA synthetase
MENPFVKDLKERGILNDIMPGTEELLTKEMVTGYIGFDPTADSLHVGSLAQIMTLVRFQNAGHKPIALIGGATAMIGDPSGKSKERNLIDQKTIDKNILCIEGQLTKFLDFNCGSNSATIIDNNLWMQVYSFVDFLRDVGKHFTVNYMMTKDSVKSRLLNDGEGMSFTEFSYQLIQANDFLHLNYMKHCKLQMGGSDQWGNMTSGAELIRKTRGGASDAFCITTNLILKSDGTKFGKTEEGNIWLDKNKTSPYKFYQFWIGTNDEDALRFLKIFTLLSMDEINDLQTQHKANPELGVMQKALAKDVTTRVHGEKAFKAAIEASNILFKGTSEDLTNMDEKTFLEVFNGVPTFDVQKSSLQAGKNVLELLLEANVFPSKNEARRMIGDGGVKINKQKLELSQESLSLTDTLKNKYILVQRGKKNYFLGRII